jgi:hypothetical protein
MWVFNVKYKTDGTVDRLKARLVARGDSQSPGIDFNEAYAPVADFTSFRMLIALATHLDLDVQHIDITTAYLYGHIDTEIYMKQAPGCKVKGQENKICKLQKSIYGLKQAGRIWNSVFHNFLLQCGFKSCRVDHCVYFQQLNNGKFMLLLLYVDDIIVASNSKSAMEELKFRIQGRFKAKMLGALSCFLNIEVIRDRSNRKTWLRQQQYAEEILSEFRMSDCNTTATPEMPNSRLHSGQGPQTEAERIQMSKIPYRAAVGSLLYLASKTRPDIAHAVQQVSQFNANPGKQHWDAVKYIFRYLQGTKDLGLEYDGKSNSLHAYFGEGPTNVPLCAMFADSDWASDPDKRKSVGGFVFLLHGGIIEYLCKKTVDTPLSSTEAEWYAACAAATAGKKLRHMLAEIGLEMTKPLVIFEDNKGCISFGNNAGNKSGMRHIECKYWFLCDEIAKGTLALQKVASTDNLADIFTKPLPKAKFIDLRTRLNIRPVPQITN